MMSTAAYYEEHGFILMPGTRCASTSMKIAIGKSVGIENIAESPHKNPYTYSRRISKKRASEVEGVPIFGSCRHPVDRVVSTYQFMVVQGRLQDALKRLGITTEDSFDSFLDKFMDLAAAALDVHLAPVYDTQCYNGVYLPTSLIRYESLSWGWKKVQNASKISLPRLKVSNFTGNHMPVTKSQRKRIEEFYAIDYEAFKYE